MGLAGPHKESPQCLRCWHDQPGAIRALNFDEWPRHEGGAFVVGQILQRRDQSGQPRRDFGWIAAFRQRRIALGKGGQCRFALRQSIAQGTRPVMSLCALCEFKDSHLL